MSYDYWRIGRAYAKNERGATAIFFALTATVVVAVAGISIDFGRAYSARSQLQAAVDAAVIAGVQQEGAARELTAQTALNANFSYDGATITTAVFQTEADGTFTGTVDGTVTATLASILGTQELPIGAESKAKPLSGGEEGSGPPCLNFLDPDKWYTLRLRDGTNIDGTQCELHVHSTRDDSSAGFENTSNVEFQRVCLAGGADTPILNKEENCAVAPDSFAGSLPTVAVGGCDHNNKTFSSAAETLNPGVYCGTTNITGGVANLTLNPGLYIISGGAFTVSAADILGNGVTFYFADVNASLSMAGINSGTLSAPAFGTYKDILMYQPTGLEMPRFEIDATHNQTWTGIIHLPGVDYRIEDVSNWTWSVNLVAYSMEIRDVNGWTLTPHIETSPPVGAMLTQ